jgi:excisionase family DNA binding protein
VNDENTATATTPWRTAIQAAARAQVSEKTIYRAVAAKQLRAARVGGRRKLVLRDEWIDAWLESTATPIEVRR